MGFRDECGVFGIFRYPEAANITYLGLYALQHRGQESAGIVSTDGEKLFVKKSPGLVQEVFDEDKLEELPGHSAIGHVRYSTTGGSDTKNVQPFYAQYARGSLAIAHNGNLTNSEQLKRKLETAGTIFYSSSDTEVIVHLIARSVRRFFIDRLTEALEQVQGAYSLCILTPKKLVAVRDPHGVRPLVLGKLEKSYVIASETCAFDLIGATLVREIEPGEILIIDEKGLSSYFPFKNPPKVAQCVFEHIYFARPDSQLFGLSVYETRKALGKQLAKEHPAQADVVIPVPDSGVMAAIGFSEQSGIPFDMGIIRNHYVGRTFIEPKQSIRHFGVKVKLNAVRKLLDGKRVVIVDDSIVRGTTSQKIIKMIRNAGAKEVHMRISAPPTISPCFYGIDTPTREELIASSNSIEEICKFLSADSLGYISKEGLLAVTNNSPHTFCTACFDRKYPIPLTDFEGH